MMHKGLQNSIRFILVLLVQIILLNNIRVGGYINPYFYIYFILLLPFETPKWLLLCSSFFLGISLDFFSGTMGMHAAASTLMAFSRPFVIQHIRTNKDFENGLDPSLFQLGFRWFMTYTLILTSIHHIFYFYIEIFNFSEFWETLYRAFISILFTSLIILTVELLFHSKRKTMIY